MPRKGDVTMSLNLSAKEMGALTTLAVDKSMTKTAIIRQALRLYQLVDHRLSAGETMIFSGDEGQTKEFIGFL